MNTQTRPQADTDRRQEGDVSQAVSHIHTSISAMDDVLDELRKCLDSILLDLPEQAMESVAKEAQNRSPLADELHGQASRIIAQRMRLQHLCKTIQL